MAGFWTRVRNVFDDHQDGEKQAAVTQTAERFRDDLLGQALQLRKAWTDDLIVNQGDHHNAFISGNYRSRLEEINIALGTVEQMDPSLAARLDVDEFQMSASEKAREFLAGSVERLQELESFSPDEDREEELTEQSRSKAATPKGREELIREARAHQRRIDDNPDLAEHNDPLLAIYEGIQQGELEEYFRQENGRTHGNRADGLQTGRLFVAEARAGNYAGQVISVNESEAVQRVSPGVTVTHRTALLDRTPESGEWARINYADSHGTVKTFEPRQMERALGR